MAELAESPSQSPVPVEEEPAPSSTTPHKKSKTLKSKETAMKKSTSKPTHPATSALVLNAIKTLQDRNGSSLQAIKKFIASNYKLDTDKLAPFIRKYLKNAVISGKLTQTKGKGASGSFKIPTTAAKPSNEKKKKPTKPKLADKKSKVDKKEKKSKEKLSTTTTTAKTPIEKNKHSLLKKDTKKSNASIKSAAPKQKSTKTSKVASKVKAPKTKKAPSVRKAASAGTGKKSPKTAKFN